MQEYITEKKVGEKVNFLVIRNGTEIECFAEIIDINGNSQNLSILYEQLPVKLPEEEEKAKQKALK